MDGDERRKERVSVVAIVAAALASLLAAFSYYCYIRAKVSKHRKALVKETNEEKKATAAAAAGGGGGGEVVVGERGLQVFSYKQLHAATGGFGKGNVVGHGSFGTVYRGVLSDGKKIAVKLMDRSGKQGEEEFKMEVELLTRLRSPYLLALVGYCNPRFI